jgi:ABC-type polysaccharide/polyol phosphate export permease
MSALRSEKALRRRKGWPEISPSKRVRAEWSRLGTGAVKVPALLRDLAEALHYAEAVHKYAWVDIRLRFDRTVLGPFWVVVTTLLWVLTVGLVMAELFQQPLMAQLPYLTFGLFAWQYVSTVVLEATSAFTVQRHFLEAHKLPLTFFVLRAVWRNLIVLVLLTAVAVVMALAFGLVRPSVLWHAPSVLALYALISVALVTILACIGSRFLDTVPMVTIVMNIMIMVTPIFWRKDLLPPDHIVTKLNPLISVVDLYRDLFLEGGASAATYAACLLLAGVLWIGAVVVFGLAHARVRNWI